MSEHPRREHPAVPHPVRMRLRDDAKRYEKGLRGKLAAGNDIVATHLGLVFGSVYMVWVFFIWPLIAQYMGSEVLGKTSYYAQSWVQLFALPLFVYIGNKLQRSSDAQSEAVHQAQTHIATVSDQIADLLDTATAGGLTDVLDAVRSLDRRLSAAIAQARGES
jgi:hypothetical protein